MCICFSVLCLILTEKKMSGGKGSMKDSSRISSALGTNAIHFKIQISAPYPDEDNFTALATQETFFKKYMRRLFGTCRMSWHLQLKVLWRQVMWMFLSQDLNRCWAVSQLETCKSIPTHMGASKPSQSAPRFRQNKCSHPEESLRFPFHLSMLTKLNVMFTLT